MLGSRESGGQRRAPKHAAIGEPAHERKLRGTGFSPLYENVPKVAMLNPSLYELLALLDAIRDGRAREREIAIRELSARIDLK